MDRIIRDESAASGGAGAGSGKGVNFQKASCTIDASIKIYSNRVDDTWSTSYRILENLNRNDGSASAFDAGGEGIEMEGEGNDGDDGDGDSEGVAIKKVTKKSSAKARAAAAGGVSLTIEKNVNNINLSPSDMAGASPHADPMFQKMSQVFDEGGAKGMLLTNLVTPSSLSSLSSLL
jgi:condensin complex subunit 2